MDRGKILQCSQDQGNGCVVSNTRQFDFNIRQWKGSSAPTLNRIVEVDVREGALVSVVEVPEDVILGEKAAQVKAQASKARRQLGDQGLKVWRRLVASAGLVAVIAQIAYILSLFGLPAASIHMQWFQGSTTLYQILSDPTVNMPPLYMWCLYASCVAICLPVVVKSKKSWLALLLPLLLMLIVGYEAYAKLQEMGAEGNFFGQIAAEGIRQGVNFEIGSYTIVASAAIMAVQGIRKFLVHG
jgi:hypothetical protein